MTAYDVIYLLKPIKEVEPGWWKLRWRPIWRHTFSIYTSKNFDWFTWGFRCVRCDAQNGWNRSYNHFVFDMDFGKLGGLNFWIRWNFIVHQDGPGDVSNPKPLNLDQP